jgi:dihydrofolate synthase/folylpolyglutamate synthase
MAETSHRTLDEWLAFIEAMHPRSIDLGLDRVGRVALSLGLNSTYSLAGASPVPAQDGTAALQPLRCPVVITVGGTNGKGSTCALLESVLIAAGYRVGLYTSPHLIHFNERARINGISPDDAELVQAFEAVERARQDVSLTYFEFTTLAVLWLFARSQLDVAVLEIGLGGRLDAVNLVDADCAVLTSIDIDHADWLGPTREHIGLEKAHIYREGRPAICADPQPPKSLLEHAKAIGADLRCFGIDFNYAGDRQQWSWGGRDTRRNSLAYPALRGANQLLNASAVLAALEALKARLPVTQQAVRQGFALVSLPGRFQVLPGRPSVVLDVAHNPHAAAHLASNLDNMGFFPQTWAVFGVMRDKDIRGIVRAMGDRIERWLLVSLPGDRAAATQTIGDALLSEGILPERFEYCVSPRAALGKARASLNEDDRIVVFGSFLTVADILTERAQASSSTPESRGG